MAKSDTSKKPKASADQLIKPTNKTDIELTETELDKVSGGPTAVELKYNLKYNFKI